MSRGANHVFAICSMRLYKKILVVGPLDFCSWEEWDMALAALDERLQGTLP